MFSSLLFLCFLTYKMRVMILCRIFLQALNNPQCKKTNIYHLLLNNWPSKQNIPKGSNITGEPYFFSLIGHILAVLGSSSTNLSAAYSHICRQWLISQLILLLDSSSRRSCSDGEAGRLCVLQPLLGNLGLPECFQSINRTAVPLKHLLSLPVSQLLFSQRESYDLAQSQWERNTTVG